MGFALLVRACVGIVHTRNITLHVELGLRSQSGMVLVSANPSPVDEEGGTHRYKSQGGNIDECVFTGAGLISRLPIHRSIVQEHPQARSYDLYFVVPLRVVNLCGEQTGTEMLG